MSSSSPNVSGAGHFITIINPNDVLFGRGSGPNDHEGNIRFRDLVGERKAEYMATNHRQTKAKIAREIVGRVIQKNGRFLKRVEPAEAKELGIPKGVEAWIAVDEETIMEKAKQALRQQRDKSKPRSPRGSPPPPARRAISAPSAPSLDSFAKPGPRYRAEASAEDLLHAKHMQNVEAELAGYSHTAHLHPNPYEPIPIGSHAVLGPGSNGLNLDWRHYTQAAIMAQTQGHRQQAYAPQPEPIPQLPVSNANNFARPASRDRRDTFVSTNVSDRRESIQVTDLMDSFNRMKTRGFDAHFESVDTMGTASSRDHESTDTIETIEPISVSGTRDPSALSMSSGNFSALMKGLVQDSSRCTETALLKGILEDPFGHSLQSAAASKTSSSRPGQRDSNRQSINIEDKDFFKKSAAKGVVGSGSDFSNMSMSLSQVWNQKIPGNLDNLAEGDESQEPSTSKPPGGPRQVVLMDDDPDNMSGLGKSSMSILNVAMGESQGESIMTANESIFSDIGD